MPDLDGFIALILLKNDYFQDSYSLTKALSWKFSIITVSQVTEKLQNAGLIKSIINNGISRYELTESGLEYIQTNTGEIKQLLLQKYKNEQPFIESIFNFP